MKVLVIGNGGREHALAWRIRQSPQVNEVLVAPGNAGTAFESGMRNVPVSATDIDGLLAMARQERVDLTVVGPEAPLSLGIVDRFAAAGLRCFGPTQAAAQLETSKAFTKAFLERHGIPTAQYRVFTDIECAKTYVHQRGAPIVVKADGLAAGKGVVVAQTIAEADAAVDAMLGGDSLGAAGHRVVIEDFLVGEEASYIVIADGTNYVALATSQDHKRRDNGDQGPNTGGMGAYSPAPVVTADVDAQVRTQIIEPTLAAMRAEGHPFVGFLYAGLMIHEGSAKVLEYNVRCGDPETQPIMMRLKSDVIALYEAAIDGRLAEVQAEWDSNVAVGVVLAAEGYPANVRKGDTIDGLSVTQLPDVKVFHAATRLRDGVATTDGGRVLTVCARGESLSAARKLAYQRCESIRWPGLFYRRDIGHRGLR